MADLADMIQKLAFYQGGGKDPGTDTVDKLNAGLGVVDKTINDVLAVKKANLDRKKVQGDMAKTAQETAGLSALNQEAVPARPEILGQPAREAQVKYMPRGGIFAQEAQPEILAQPAQPGMTFGQLKTRAEAEKDLATAEYYRNGGKSSGSVNKKTPALDIYRPEFLQRRFPGVKDFSQYTEGDVVGETAYQNQMDLNNSRERNYGLRVDQATLNYAKDHILRDPIMLKIHEQNLGLDAVDAIARLVSEGNTVAASAMGLKQAKGLGEVGVMTDQDVVRYVRSGKLSQLAADKLSGWLKGIPSEATQQEIMQINEAIKSRLAEKEQEITVPAVDRFARNFGLSPSEAAYQLGVNYKPELLQQQTTTGATVPAGVQGQIQQQLPQGTKILKVEKL